MKRLLLSAALLLSAGVAQAAPIPVKVVVVANWENGADTGDAPGEFQDWVEREHLDEKVPVRGAPDVVRRNKDGLYGLVLRHGVTDLAAFVLDPRFDLTHTYWLFTGISGVDPRVASVGSASWARWVVDGDEAREIDDRTVPAGWPYGLWAIGATRPNQLPYDANHFGSVTDMKQLDRAYPLNRRLARWAFELTRNVRLGDDDAVRKARARWTGFPEAQKPPFVLEGETLGALRYWHGEPRTQWARDWVSLWTRGQGRFVMTNMESQTYQKEMRAFAAQGFVDPDRIMVLRTASNFSEPPPGVAVTASIGDEGPGQVLAFDSNQRAGAPVLHELLAHWDRYRDHIPGRDDTP
ncbi:purine nucleoside permease [Acetobacteraceae bacterium KSS8]|uniref:Purine nucleoside permease n=1 Tax=Endosaccharibacter trunci TaxID=2812733 RepID=A0ABT1W3K4_9PROT|nr:purine nucleoside permease [Acetobacteraceae bacterium KSS8]